MEEGRATDLNIAMDKNMPTTETMDMEKETESKSSRFNKELLRYKLSFFLLAGALGSLMPYVPLIAMEKIKLSASSFAAATLGRTIVIILGKIIFGYVADYFNNVKFIFSTLASIQMVFAFFFLFIPPISVNETESRGELRYLEMNDANNCQWVNSSSEFLHELRNKQVRFSTDVSFNISTECISQAILSVPTVRGENGFTICSKSESDSYQLCHSASYDNMSYFEKVEKLNISQELYNNSEFCSFASKAFCTEFHSVNKTCCLFKNDSKSSNIHNKTQWLKDIATYQFWAFFVVYSIIGVASQVIFNLQVTACSEATKKHNADLGKQMLWKGLGHAIFATFTGLLNDYTHSYLAGICISAALLILLVLNTCQMDLNKPSFPEKLLKNLGTIMKSKDFLSFQLGLLFNGICFGTMLYYLCWFIRSLNGKQLICGLTSAVHMMGEVPFMFFSGLIIKQISYFNIITVALLVYCLRFLWFSYVHNPWYIMVFEWAHGISYSLLFPTMASFSKLKSIPGTEATTQAIIFSTHLDLGAILGCIISGIGFDFLGGRRTLFYTSIFSACCIPISLFLSFINRKKVI